jgi:hypothetical protein
MAGDTVKMRYWRRPLRAMWDAFTGSGFAVETLSEPGPLPETAERFPDAYRQLTTAPAFIFFVLRPR